MWEIGEIRDRMRTIGTPEFSPLAGRTKTPRSHTSVPQADEHQEPYQNNGHWDKQPQYPTTYDLCWLLRHFTNVRSECKAVTVPGPPTPCPCLHQPYLESPHTCSASRKNCPQVLTLQIPGRPPGRNKMLITLHAQIHIRFCRLNRLSTPNTNTRMAQILGIRTTRPRHPPLP